MNANIDYRSVASYSISIVLYNLRMLDMAVKCAGSTEPDRYRLEQVSKFRLERSIEMKQLQQKSVKEKRLTRYTELNWQQYEQKEEHSGIDLQSCRSVEIAQQELLP